MFLKGFLNVYITPKAISDGKYGATYPNHYSHTVGAPNDAPSKCCREKFYGNE